MSDLPNIIGYIGTISVIIMQIFTQLGIKPSASFHILPLAIFGNICLIYSLFYHHNTPVLISQIVMLVIAVIGLLRLFYYKWKGLL